MSAVKAGLYVRLSREDEGKDGVSESIKNQQDFLKKYAMENNFEVIKIYADDGYSGTNFDRPAFCEMIDDIECGKINAVLTKDLSRLGRDYIMIGHYIERYFPSKNVRFIAVNDGVDTATTMQGGDMTPFRSVINDMYARDISQKVRTALTTKKKNGAFIGSCAPYGYKKDLLDKNKLVIDEKVAQYVKLIFQMYLSGTSLRGIANTLSEMNIPTPSQYKNLTATQKRFHGVWNDAMIRRMLSNPTYIGNMTQNRTKKINYKLDKKVSLPQSEWITVENTHEAIIEKSDFTMVQRQLKTRSYHTEKRGGAKHLLTGLIFCGGCKSPMTPVGSSGGRTYLICSTWKKHAGLNLCTSHCIREDIVVDAVVHQLKELFERYINISRLIKECGEIETPNVETQLLEDLESQEANLKSAKLMLYKDKASGVVSEIDYISFSKQLDSEIIMLQKQQKELFEKVKDMETYDPMNGVLTFESPDRNLLLALVNRIDILEDKTIEIEFAFENPAGE